MGGTEVDRRNGDEEMLARSKCPWSGHTDRDPKSVPRKDLDVSRRASTSDVSVTDNQETDDSLFFFVFFIFLF